MNKQEYQCVRPLIDELNKGGVPADIYRRISAFVFGWVERYEKRQENKKSKMPDCGYAGFAEKLGLPGYVHNYLNTFVDYLRDRHPNAYRSIQNSGKSHRKWWWDSLVTIERLMRIDGFTWEEIKAAIDFAMNDPFWQKVFRSITKLRKTNAEGIKYIAVWLDKAKHRQEETDINRQVYALKKMLLNNGWQDFPPEVQHRIRKYREPHDWKIASTGEKTKLVNNQILPDYRRELRGRK